MTVSTLENFNTTKRSWRQGHSCSLTLSLFSHKTLALSLLTPNKTLRPSSKGTGSPGSICSLASGGPVRRWRWWEFVGGRRVMIGQRGLATGGPVRRWWDCPEVYSLPLPRLLPPSSPPAQLSSSLLPPSSPPTPSLFPVSPGVCVQGRGVGGKLGCVCLCVGREKQGDGCVGRAKEVCVCFRV